MLDTTSRKDSLSLNVEFVKVNISRSRKGGFLQEAHTLLQNKLPPAYDTQHRATNVVRFSGENFTINIITHYIKCIKWYNLCKYFTYTVVCLQQCVTLAQRHSNMICDGCQRYWLCLKLGIGVPLLVECSLERKQQYWIVIQVSMIKCVSLNFSVNPFSADTIFIH